MTWRRRFAILLILIAAALAGSAVPAQAAPPADPRRQLQHIEQQPLYQRWRLREERTAAGDPGMFIALRRWIRSELDDLDGWLRKLFSHSPSASHAAAGEGLADFLKAVGWIALALLLVGLIAVAIRLWLGRRRAAAPSAVLSREQVADALQQGNALALAGDQWLDEAGRLAQEKNFRAMYRALYLALLSGLHARGKIDFNRFHTNWTYVNRYRGETPEREIFSSLTALFDNVWYGLQNAERSDIQALRQQVHALIGPPPGAPSAGGGAGAK